MNATDIDVTYESIYARMAYSKQVREDISMKTPGVGDMTVYVRTGDLKCLENSVGGLSEAKKGQNFWEES